MIYIYITTMKWELIKLFPEIIIPRRYTLYIYIYTSPQLLYKDYKLYGHYIYTYGIITFFKISYDINITYTTLLVI